MTFEIIVIKKQMTNQRKKLKLLSQCVDLSNKNGFQTPKEQTKQLIGTNYMKEMSKQV